MISTRYLLALLVVVTALSTSEAPAAPTSPQPSAGSAELFGRLDADADGRLTASEIPPDRQRLFARLLRTSDADGDQALSSDEFAAGLRPSGIEKPFAQPRAEAFYGADALRYLLLRMDADGDSQLEPDEVSSDLREPFERMIRMRDQNRSGVLERDELSRGGIHLAPFARQWTDRQGIDVAAENAKLRRALGPQAERFDWEPLPGNLFGDQDEIVRLFRGLDDNGDKQLEEAEVPDQFHDRFLQLVQLADRDGNGRLSPPEFRSGAQQLAAMVDPAERAAGGGSGAPMPDAMEGGDAMEMPSELP